MSEFPEWVERRYGGTRITEDYAQAKELHRKLKVVYELIPNIDAIMEYVTPARGRWDRLLHIRFGGYRRLFKPLVFGLKVRPVHLVPIVFIVGAFSASVVGNPSAALADARKAVVCGLVTVSALMAWYGVNVVLAVRDTYYEQQRQIAELKRTCGLPPAPPTETQK